MSEKYSVIRSENKLADLDPKIQALFDKKHIRIVKAEEAEAEETKKTEEELIKSMVEGIVSNAESIQKIIEKRGLSEELEEEESESEEILEKITKNIEERGFDIKMVQKGKRRKIIQ